MIRGVVVIAGVVHHLLVVMGNDDGGEAEGVDGRGLALGARRLHRAATRESSGSARAEEKRQRRAQDGLDEPAPIDIELHSFSSFR